MPENSKYDFFMDELNSLEKQIYTFVQREIELSEENKGLKSLNVQLSKENEVLKLKLEDLEEKVQNDQVGHKVSTNNLLNSEDKETLKNKIDDLITKIDYHLRS